MCHVFLASHPFQVRSRIAIFHAILVIDIVAALSQRAKFSGNNAMNVDRPTLTMRTQIYSSVSVTIRP